LNVFGFWVAPQLDFSIGCVRMKKSKEVEEVSRMKDVCKFDEFDFLKMLKDEGIIVGSVITNSGRFIDRCYMLGFKPSQFKVWF